jgi:ATP-dependent Clp protease ATP-binding subunit ClpX
VGPCAPQALSEEELAHVLCEPRNALVKQYARILAKNGCAFRVTRAGVAAVAREAAAKGVGARGLRSILERALLEAMFHVGARPPAACVRASLVAGLLPLLGLGLATCTVGRRLLCLLPPVRPCVGRLRPHRTHARPGAPRFQQQPR